MKKWWVRVLAVVGVLLATLVATAYFLLSTSLPDDHGSLRHARLTAPAWLERDAHGIVTARASDRADLAFALGFAHGQDRFFQMDLTRRSAAGTLSALVGPAAVDLDRSVRKHRFAAVASACLERLTPRENAWLVAYADGVNAGLGTLGARPPEYWLLRQEPAPWRPDDTFLVVLAMYLNLQGGEGAVESIRGRLHEALPPALAAFLDPAGTAWDAPLFGAPRQPAPMPAPEEVDLRTHPLWEPLRATPVADPSLAARVRELETIPHEVGSNNMAVAGHLTTHGGALVADDMHLGLDVPNIWYRAALQLEVDDPARAFRAEGVTLPGVPTVVAGTNGFVAWGHTNSYGDWHDLVILEPGPEAGSYLTPDGPEPFRVHEETIEVAGSDPVVETIRWTRWGPVVDRDASGRERALRWLAHDAEATDLRLGLLEIARSAAQALELAGGVGVPSQNLVTGDRDGHIGWVLTGRIPRRFGFDGRVPTSWADGTRGWNGYHGPDRNPRLLDPPSGRIWTANTRVLDGEALALVGDGGYALGARARQIRDALDANAVFDEGTLYGIQLDDRAIFLSRWRDLLLDLLDASAVDGEPERAEFRRLIEDGWTGRAGVDDVGYRMVRAFRLFTAPKVFEPLTDPCRAPADKDAGDPGPDADPREPFRYLRTRQYEAPLWTLVTERPAHLLDPREPDWRTFLLDRVDETIGYFLDDPEDRLADKTWGERNTVRIHHPLGSSVPFLGKYFNMDDRPIPGDRDMPRVQGIRQGASQRMVVAPGREADAIMTMPTGQSGHFLSPNYGDLHDDWAEGRRTPLRPGPTVRVWKLLPAR